MESPRGLHKPNAIVCHTLVQARVLQGGPTDLQVVSCGEMSWGGPERSSIVEPGEPGSGAAANIAPQTDARSGGHGFILQPPGERGRFWKGKKAAVKYYTGLSHPKAEQVPQTAQPEAGLPTHGLL